ncbi:MAG: carbonic anhydrase [Sulfurimicrobium sp.]|nr:carbonic anhydrase [Sulfurimicrobium sp.]
MPDIGKFIAGFKRFQDNYFGQDRHLYEQLKLGQYPRALVVACCDSRVDPAILTGSEPGDIFVVRNVANLVPPREYGGGYHGVSAALEFAVCQLGVEHIIVLGHSQCGGIRALMRGSGNCENAEYVAKWVQIAAPARDKVLHELPQQDFELQVRACEQAAILQSLENLLSFPWIAQRMSTGDLAAHGWYFDLDRGELLGYDPAVKSFVPLKEGETCRDSLPRAPETP